MNSSSQDFLHRSRVLMGKEAIEKLAGARVLLAGAGGVGSYIAEALVRGGVGSLTIFDPDTVHMTNINRQLPALHSTCGKTKTQVIGERLKDINPALQLQLYDQALTSENILSVLQEGKFDYVADAIDSLQDKCFLLASCHRLDIPVISAMGAGCRLDPAKVQYADISKTFNCQLAKNVRSTLKKSYGITRGIKCVFSSETPIKSAISAPTDDQLRVIGSSSYMPGIFGLFMAAEIIRDLTRSPEEKIQS